MDLKLKNKKVLVTGSTTGIGFAIAKSFANEGAIVYLNGRTEAKVKDAFNRITAEIPGSNVKGIVADLTTETGFNTLTEVVPNIDILINNLGIYEPVDFFESKDEDWTKMFDVNVLTGIRVTRFYMPKMLKANWGRVVFISSESGIQIPTEMIHYGMSKTAQLSIANGLAQLTKGTEVTVNSILPGPTFSEGVEQFIADLATQKNLSQRVIEQQFFEETRPLSLIQRFITPDEVANTVVYFSSELAAATNGAAIRVDGGIIQGIN